MSTGCLALVPLRSMSAPKTRLSAVLRPAERTALVATLADAVLDALAGAVSGAAAGVAMAVVTDSDDVVSWCHARGVDVVRPGGGGLNEAIAAGLRHGRTAGFEQLAVVPADLARPRRLVDALAIAAADDRLAAVSAVADRHADGTNLLVVPTDLEFVFAYGPGSFAAHRAEARRLGREFVSIDDDELAWDVDTPDDLAWYESQR